MHLQRAAQLVGTQMCVFCWRSCGHAPGPQRPCCLNFKVLYKRDPDYKREPYYKRKPQLQDKPPTTLLFKFKALYKREPNYKREPY